MLESKTLQPTEAALAIRTLKIEAQSDFWKGVSLRAKSPTDLRVKITHPLR